MGRRFWIGIILLLILLTAGLLSVASMCAICVPMERSLLQAQTLAMEGDLPHAIALARQAKDSWDSRRDFMAILADHSPMDDAGQLFAELEVYGSFQDATHFAACCGSLAVMCRAMIDAHAPAWQNLL